MLPEGFRIFRNVYGRGQDVKRTDVEELIKQLRRNQKPGWEKTSASYLFARQRHPSEYIGTNTVAEAWNELHAERKLDSRASIHAISKRVGWVELLRNPSHRSRE